MQGNISEELGGKKEKEKLKKYKLDPEMDAKWPQGFCICSDFDHRFGSEAL